MTSGNINFSGGSIVGPMIGTNTGNVTTAYAIDYGDVQPKEVDAVTLAGARAQLAALPLATIPDPAPLPHGSHLPLGFSRNALFVGRADDLKALALAISGGATTAIGQSAAVTGMGGLGKTQLANEFVHRYGQFFAGGVVWLSFEQPDSIPGQIAACHPLVADPAVAFKLILAEWQSPLPRLLIFDNCEDEKLLKRWRPPGSGCYVVVTSRRQTWDPALGVRRLPLGVLDPIESIALLRQFRPDLPPDDPDLAALAAELGHLPLALHIAGSFLHSYRADYTPAAYLHELRATPGLDHDLLTGDGISPTDHDQSVFRTFKLSYDRLNAADAVDALALQLLVRAACFAPGEPIPRDLLKRTLQLSADDKPAQWQATRALSRLADLGLLEAEAAGALRMHRLVALFVRSVAQDDEAQDAVERAMIDVAYDLNTAGDPRPLLELQTHLRHVTDLAYRRDDEQAATLCANLGDHLQMVGDYTGARPYVERALAICEQVLGAMHPDTAGSLNNLAILCYYEGDLAEAAQLMRRALGIREQVLGPDHPDTQSSQQSLAVIEQQLAGPQTVEQQIAEVAQRAEAAVDQAEAEGSAEQRAALAEQIEAAAIVYAGGQAEGSPYLALAARLRALVERLRRGES